MRELYELSKHYYRLGAIWVSTSLLKKYLRGSHLTHFLRCPWLLPSSLFVDLALGHPCVYVRQHHAAKRSQDSRPRPTWTCATVVVRWHQFVHHWSNADIASRRSSTLIELDVHIPSCLHFKQVNSPLEIPGNTRLRRCTFDGTHDPDDDLFDLNRLTITPNPMIL